MKMSKALYDELKADIKTVLGSMHPDRAPDKFEPHHMWVLFNNVMAQRMNDDSHPMWRQNGGALKRILPFWSRNGESRDMQGNDHWLNRFYVEEDLNDGHIETALGRILKEL